MVELAGVLAGPSAGQFLAELGADVVKVEPPGGDVTRRWRLASEPDTDRPAYFQAANWGKRSVSLDLGHADGRAALHALVRTASVVLTAYRPGHDARLGADADTLVALRPGLVIVRLSGYGADDARAGYDAVVQAESGFMAINGAADGPPTKLPVALMDLLAAHQIKEAVLAALLRRARTGEGAVVDVSLLGAATGALANQGTAWLAAGEAPRRMGSAHPQIAPYGEPYAASDGDVILAVGTDVQFAALSDVLGLAPDARFASNPGRVRHRDALDAALRPAIAAWTRDALLAALDVRGVPSGAVREVAEALAHPEAPVVRGGDFAGLRQVTFREAGASPSVSPADLREPPAFAAHTREVLREVAPDAADRWIASGGAVEARQGAR